MNKNMLNQILKDRKRKTRSLALILCLSMIVSLGTFAGFHKTAQAKVYTKEVLDCPYTYEGAEPVAHVHNDDCYEGETLVCTLPEREAHTHTDECFTEQRVLVCGLEENPGHQHSEECFDENGELICQIPEGEGAHAHTGDCYTIERVLTCDRPELNIHVHDAGCFRTEEISVDEPEETAASEQAVSTVPEMPVSDPNADLETAEDWNREFENFELSGNWVNDLVLVAATQQGRGESPNNFEAVLNDAGDAWVRHGYTRYGAWYGYPYAEWDAMFVSFCLRYAGIPAENVPNNPTAAFMAESFSMGGLFAGRDYVPAVGDLIFFDTIDDEITNIDHMGIVYHVDAENGTINTVEGDRTDAVATFGYHLDDEEIVGYGILPQDPDFVPAEDENEEPESVIVMTTDEEENEEKKANEETKDTVEETVPAVPMPAQSWERIAGGIKVTVEAPEGAFPENTRIAVTPVNGNSLKDTVSGAVDGEVLEVQAVDITFFDADGHEIEPAVPIRVVMTPAATENAEEKTSVVHVNIEQQTAELIEQAAGTEFDNSEVVFDADAFTIYAIVYTYQVDFEYEVDGQVYTSSMPGAENMTLTQIVEGLGIVGEDEIGTFVSKIASVVSTNEEVAIVTEDNEVRVLKDGEAQIVITMQDGAVFSIDVSAEGETEVTADNVAISTVGDLYLPAAAVANAEVVDGEEAIEAVKAETGEEAEYTVFDISLENVDAEKYEGFQVELQLPESVIGKEFHLYHVHDGAVEELELNKESVAVDGETELVRTLSFVTSNFSEFVLSYTVDFEYVLDGKVYTYSMPGGEKMLFSEIIYNLGVCKSLPEAELFSSKISNMVFSDDSLLRVTSVNQDSQIPLYTSTGDGEDELIATEDENYFSEAFDIADVEYMVINGNDWLLESLAPFTSEEALTITFEDGQVFTVKVTDAQYGTGNIEIGDDGVVSLIDLANISATCQSNTTDVEWDAQIDFLLRYVFTDDGVSAVTHYVRDTHTSPIIEYDFSRIFDKTALNSVVGASYYLSTGSKTVGRLTVSEDGKVTITFSDLGWLVDRNSLRGTFNLDLLVDEDEAKENGSDTVVFPGTTTGTEITYKTTVSNAAKSLGWPNSVENEDGSITIFYNASIDANTALDSLHFYDTITAGGAIIDADSVKVNGNNVTGLSNGTSIDFDIANVSGISKTDEGKLPAGRYTVSYTATIPASTVSAMAEGDSTTVVNSSHWKINGTTDVDADPVTYTWTKPVTPIPVTKEADKTSIDMTSGTGETVNYTLTFGDSNTPLANFRIADYITDVFTDYSGINVSWNGGSTTLTASSQATDSNYSTGSLTLFDYTFPSDNTAYGPVTVTYSAKTIDSTTAKRSGIFDTVNATNKAQELRTNNSQTSTTVITYPERPDISLSKTASIPDEYKNEDGTLKDGATITYTITIGDSSTDVSNLNITDTMSHLQSVDLSTATIQIGTEASQSLTEYISSVNGSYDQHWYSGGGSSNLFNFTVPAGENDSEVMGPIVITYTTTVMSADDAHTANIWGEQAVNNTVNAGGKSSTDGGTIDYGEQPKFPVEKQAKDENDREITEPLTPGDKINYIVTYGGEGWTLDGTLLIDEMSDIQKLTGSVTVTLDKALLRTITWPDGTVWTAGQTSFTMPTGSSQWAGDGVVWTDFFDDGQYSLNGSWPRVYALRLPDGRGEGNPYFSEDTEMTVTYSTTIITEEEALTSGITGLQSAYNRTTANNQSSQTTVPVQFPDEVTHEPTIQKAFDHWDFDGRNVYWTITVAADTANGSTYPLSDITVYENVVWSGVQIKNDNQHMWSKVIEADAFDMVNAMVVTASGVVLQPGEDYTVYKGKMNEGGTDTTEDPYFHFDTLEEPVTITLCYNIGDNEIIDGFYARNQARLNNGKDSTAEQTYNTNNIDMTKNGDTFDQSKRVIKWVVRINPALKTIEPDMTKVIFNDTMPEGLKLINYSAYLNGSVDLENPSFRVDYVGKISGSGREYGASSYNIYKSVSGSYQYDNTIFATVTNSAITNANIAAIGVYNDDNNAFMSGQGYVVTYYTYIDDTEWNSITSSLTGSKTYENTATVEMDGQDDLDATGYKTIDSNNFIWKEDTTQENSNGIVIDSENQNTNVLSFRIDVNPYAMQLVSEEGAMLTLTDRISTNMDLDTSGDGVTVEYETADGTFVNIKDVGSDSEYYEQFQAIKVSYNDDTRYVTITNIPDKIHFRMTYHTVVRAQGTDTFENTAVLTGGGSHSASTSEEHTIQKSGGNIAGNTANITLRKIDENDISTKVVGATFEIYECTLSNPDTWKYTVQVPIITEDKETHEITTTWVEEQHFDFNRIEAATPNQWTGYAGNSETAQLKEDFTVTGTTLLGVSQSDNDGIVHMPDTLKEETLYYWIETATADGYTAELNVPHYFIVYQVYDDDENLMDIMTKEVDSSGTALAEWQAKQWRGWALDDAAQYANDITVASLAAENTWTVNNQESEYTSISATKTWAGDYDNFYETRPKEGIQLKLIQISSDGTETQYGPIVPINVDDNGNWPTYVWQQLPKTGNNDVTYTYRVEEIPVSGYTTAYTVDGSEQPVGGIESGEVTVTNTLIPTKTNISVKKVFDQDGTTYPDQILVYLYEITTSKEDGSTSRAQRSSYALTAAGNWTYTWRNLPTKDADGNALTYTVVEGDVGDGFSYTVSYSDNGEGITGNTAEDPLVITNTENGLEITKTLGGDAARLMEDTETAAAMRALISFTVTDGTNQVSFTLADMTANEDGTYCFKLTSSTYPWLTPGKTVYVQETNEAFTNTDLVSVSYAINGGDTVTVTENMETVTVNGYTVTGGLDTIDFTNEYHEDTVNLSVDKKWLNVEGVEQDREYWPEGMVVTFNLTADEGDGAIATEATKIMTAAGQTVTFEDLPKYVLNTETEIVYSVTETVDGYESSIASRTVDEDGNVFVIVKNQKASPRLYIQKVWSGSSDFIPSSLTIDLYESTTEGATSGGTLVNTITITAPDWKGYFDTDSKGNDLEEGKFYYIVERGVGGWTLSGYSDENGQAFVDLETITVTNTRNTPPPEYDSVAVQKKWTVNGEEADPEDWEEIEVQLVRYKAEAPTGTTVKIYYMDNGTPTNRNIQRDVTGEVTIQLNTNITDPNKLGNSGYKYSFTVYSGDWWPSISGTPLAYGSSIDTVTFDLSQSPYTGHEEISVVFGPAWGDLAKDHLSPTISGDTPVIGDDIVWSGPEVVTYNEQTTFALNAENSWQYEFTNLPKSDDNYNYKYTVVEKTPGNPTYEFSDSERITITGDAQADVGGTVVITNNKDYGSITVNKSVLKNNAPDADAVGQTITVGLFTIKKENGDAVTSDDDTKVITIGSESSGSVTFDKLTLGQTYYVYEIVDGKVVTDGKTVTINNIEYTAGQSKSSATLSAEAMTATVDITNSRTEEEKGSLKITKNVTLNGSATTTTLADGAYVFSIAGPDTDTAVVKYVEITVTAGKAVSYKVADGPNAPEDWNSIDAVTFAASDENRYAVVSGLATGDYIITETPVPGMTTTVSGGKENKSDEKANTITVTVTPGDTVEAKAQVAFNNDKTPMTSFDFNKIWLGMNGSLDNTDTYQGWQAPITVTIQRKNGDTVDNSFELKYVLNAGTGTFSPESSSKRPVAEGEVNGTTLSLTASSTNNVFNFKLPENSLRETNDAGNVWTYFVKEAGLESYITKYGTVSTVEEKIVGSIAQGAEYATDGGAVINESFGGYVLPQTGGIGTSLFTTLGAILASTAGAALVLKKRKEE